MNLQRRKFLSKAFEVGGVTALMSLGLSYKAALCFGDAGFIDEAAGKSADDGAYMGSVAEPADGDATANVTTTYLHDIASTKSGYITKIEIYSGSNSIQMDFAVFSKSGTSFTDEHYVEGLWVYTGLNTYESPTDFSATALPIAVGEYIGVSVGDTWDKETSGGSGYWYSSGGNEIGDDTAATFTQSTNTTHELQFRVWIK